MASCSGKGPDYWRNLQTNGQMVKKENFSKGFSKVYSRLKKL